MEIKNGNWILVTNSYIYNRIFVQHNLKSKFIVPKTYTRIPNADEMKAENEMFPGKAFQI